MLVKCKLERYFQPKNIKVWYCSCSFVFCNAFSFCFSFLHLHVSYSGGGKKKKEEVNLQSHWLVGTFWNVLCTRFFPDPKWFYSLSFLKIPPGIFPLCPCNSPCGDPGVDEPCGSLPTRNILGFWDAGNTNLLLFGSLHSLKAVQFCTV